MILGTMVPSVQISAVGFAFKDYQKVWSAMDGALGAHVRSEIAKTGTLFAYDRMWDNGFRVTTTSTRPVATPDDLRGMKLRVPPSPIIMSIFRALDAAPVAPCASRLPCIPGGQTPNHLPVDEAQVTRASGRRAARGGLAQQW